MPMTMMKSLLPVGRLEDSHIGPMRTLLLGRHLLLPLHAHQTFSDCLIEMSLVTIIIYLFIEQTFSDQCFIATPLFKFAQFLLFCCVEPKNLGKM